VSVLAATPESSSLLDRQRSVINAQQGELSGVPIDTLLDEFAPGVKGTELGKNLQKFDSYYQELNEKLNKRIKATSRDPFKSNLSPQTRPKVNQNTRSAGGSRTAPGLLNQVKAAVGLPERAFSSSSDTPGIAFKGFMKAGGENAALLEINGLGVVVVREGDVVGVGYEEETMIRIVKINKLSVSLEVGGVEAGVVLHK